MKRLLLGESEWLAALAGQTTDRDGETTVVAANAGFVETLRETGVAATAGEPTDPDVLPEAADVVVIADADPQRTVRIAEVAADRYPDAHRIGVRPADTDDTVADRIDRAVHRLIDPQRAVTEQTTRAIHGEDADRLRRLLETLRSAPEPLLVVPHDNPDPDAIAAAITLVYLAEQVGTDALTGYYGDISHQENRALVNLLELPLDRLDDETVASAGSIALVDHAVAGVNDSLPPDTEPLVVIDHHPPTGPAHAPFYDVRPDIGATATILSEYLSLMGTEVPTRIATALLYGIRVDTKDFTIGVTPADYEAAARLVEDADGSVLADVESPSVAAGVFETLATAIENREVRESVAVSCVGEIADRDALPQAADQLLAMTGIDVAVVYGYRDGVVYASGRARGSRVDLGEVFRDAFGEVGSAGGHADMAGAQLELGVLGETEGDERLEDVLREAISGRFFETVAEAGPPPGPAEFSISEE